MYIKSGPQYSLYSFIITIGPGKDLNDEDIAKKINHHLVTVKRFLHDPMRKRKTRSGLGIPKSVTKRDSSRLKRTGING